MGKRSSERRLHRSVFLPAGLAAWIAVLVLLGPPDPYSREWIVLVLLFSPLVLVPLSLRLAMKRSGESAGLPAFTFPGALALAFSYFLEAGTLSGALAFLWFLVTATIGLKALLAIISQPRYQVAGICRLGGFLYLAVGGAWAFADRLGLRPLDFDPLIVLLTAVHFHYAGLLLPLVTGLALERLKATKLRLVGVGVLAGVPVVALGITTSHLGLPPSIETAAVTVLGMAGIGAACLHIHLGLRNICRTSAGFLWLAGGSALFAGMLLALLYGWRFYLQMQWLDVPVMAAFHGTLNATALGLGLIPGWWIAARKGLTI